MFRESGDWLYTTDTFETESRFLYEKTTAKGDIFVEGIWQL
jgi:hypothetical protein